MAPGVEVAERAEAEPGVGQAVQPGLPVRRAPKQDRALTPAGTHAEAEEGVEAGAVAEVVAQAGTAYLQGSRTRPSKPWLAG